MRLTPSLWILYLQDSIMRRITLILALFISFYFSLSGQEKRALLIGIGEYPTNSEWNVIHGDNDVAIISEWLQKNGFSSDNINSLINEEATYDGIISSLERLIELSRKNDIIYIQFSGHGQLITDLDGDENDGWDECWIPYDAYKRYIVHEYTGTKHLSDDILYHYLGRLRSKVGNGGKIIVIADSCHSGGGSRAEYDFCRGTGDKFVLPSNTVASTEMHASEKEVKWLHIAACKSYQTNYEYRMADGSYCGSLTHIISNTENDCIRASYEDLIKDWKSQMQRISKYPQTIEEEGKPNKHTNTIF